MNKPESIFVCCVFAALILAPAAARLLGVRAEAFENRALAEPPELAPARLLDTATWDAFSDWMEDHLPLRRAAVAADARMDLAWFGDSPDPQVWLGEGEWLWFDDGLRKACTGPDPAVVVAAMGRLATEVERSGRSFRWMIVPNKIGLYPEHAPERVRRAARCSMARRETLLSTLRRGAPTGFIDLFRAFDRAKSRYDHLLYYPDDSHVTHFGSGLMLQQLVASLDPAIWDPRAMRPGRPMRRTGDLARMLAVREPIEMETWAIVRPEIGPGDSSSEEPEPGVSLRRFTNDAADSLVFGRKTFVLHDSQFNTAMAMARSYFGDVNFLEWAGFAPDRVAAEMAAAEVVVVEVVERDFYWRVGRELGSEEMIEAWRRAVASEPPG